MIFPYMLEGFCHCALHLAQINTFDGAHAGKQLKFTDYPGKVSFNAYGSLFCEQPLLFIILFFDQGQRFLAGMI